MEERTKVTVLVLPLVISIVVATVLAVLGNPVALGYAAGAITAILAIRQALQYSARTMLDDVVDKQGELQDELQQIQDERNDG